MIICITVTLPEPASSYWDSPAGGYALEVEKNYNFKMNSGTKILKPKKSVFATVYHTFDNRNLSKFYMEKNNQQNHTEINSLN